MYLKSYNQYSTMDLLLGKWQNMYDYILNHRIEKGCEFTHTSLHSPMCSFYVPADELDTFYAYYENAVAGGESLYVTEKNRHIGPILIDLDFRFPLPADKSAPTRTYTKETVAKVIEAYRVAIKKYLHVKDDVKVYVLEKPGPTVFRNLIVKDGLHLIIPDVVTKASVKYLIRLEVLKVLAPVFEALGCVNKVDDIVDQAVIEKNNWFMFGSKKVDSPPYDVTSIHTLGGTVSRPKGSKMPMIQLLSIRNKYNETNPIEGSLEAVSDYEQKAEEIKRNANMTKRIMANETNQTVKVCDNLEQVESLVKILNPERADCYDDWIRLGWCLRNVDNRLIDAWVNFSSQSRKYRTGECEKAWNRMKEGGLGIGSLYLWAKKDNLAAYQELMKTDLKTLIYQSMSMTHNDIARVVFQMFQHDFVCGSIKNRVWYEFKKHRWTVSDSGLGLRLRLSEEVWKTYNLEAIDYSQKGINASNKADQDKYIEQAKKLSEIAMKLRNSSFKENIMKECSELFYVEKFEEKLDSNIFLIGFENGVYDIETHEFREGRADDYITFSTGNNYVPYDPSHPMVEAINQYLEQVFTRFGVREYVLKLFATFITGQIKEQKFYIWTGSGSNSKSMLVDLFEKSFGDYCCKFPITLLTQKRAASNAANSELARAKGKRFACLQEPSEDEKINIGLMKELSGGDKIMARALFKEPFEFHPQFKMLLLCNHLPGVPSDDGGTWRRIRVVEFTSKFVDNPQEENEFPIDYDLSSKMEGWREYFIGLLIHYLKRYQVEGITEPLEVLQCTIDYKCKNDHMSAFIEEHIEKVDGAFLTIDEVFAELKDYIKDDNVPLKLGSKLELTKYITRVTGAKISNNGGKKGWKGYRLATVGFGAAQDDMEAIQPN